MHPAMMLNDLDPANNFAMGGLPMAMVRALFLEGKPLPTTLFLDVMVEKTQKLIGLCVKREDLIDEHT